MDKLDMFQYRFVKIDELGWWDLERISSDAGTHFTSTEFRYEFQNCDVWLTFTYPEHQEMNRQVEVTQRTLRTIAHSLMVHAQALEAYINFALIYTADHIFPVLPIKYLINEYKNPTKPIKVATGKKPSTLHLCLLFCPCVVWKSTARVWQKALNMCHQSQKGFRGIFVGISQQKKRVFSLRNTQAQNCIFIRCCF